MPEDAKAPKRKQRKPHTELRRQGEDQTDKDKVDENRATTGLQPRTPVDRLPDDGDEDDLFNDMPV